MLHVLVCNYQEEVRGKLLDKWVELPKRPAELAKDLKEIKVTDSPYAIADVRTDIYGLDTCISTCDSLGELNELAFALDSGAVELSALEAYIGAKHPSLQALLLFIEDLQHS